MHRAQQLPNHVPNDRLTHSHDISRSREVRIRFVPAYGSVRSISEHMDVGLYQALSTTQKS